MELVISTYGTSLNRDNEGFVVTNQDGRQRVPLDGITSIQIHKGAQITSDAVLLAIEREIDIVFVDRAGKPMGRVWSPKYGSISSIRKGQVAYSQSPAAVSWIKDMICDKIEHQQAVLLMFSPDDEPSSRLIDKSIARLEEYKTKIKGLEAKSVYEIGPTLRGWEGQSSRIYFDAVNIFLPKEYRFDKRTQNPAMDIANAMLNYGYGMLYSKIEAELIKAGIDPYVGIMHRDEYSRPVLVYDVIEQYRMWVDYVVFNLLCHKVVNEDYYSVREDGACWLEVLGRRVLIQSINDYLEEVVVSRGQSRSRSQQITVYAQKLAQTFKRYEI